MAREGQNTVSELSDVFFTVYTLGIVIALRVIMTATMISNFYSLRSKDTRPSTRAKLERGWGIMTFKQFPLMGLQIFLLFFSPSIWRLALIPVLLIQLPLAVLGLDCAREQIKCQSVNIDRTFVVLHAAELLLFVPYFISFYVTPGPG